MVSPNEKTHFLKAKIKDCPLSSFKLYNEKDAVFALKTSKSKDFIIQKSDKGNSIVLILIVLIIWIKSTICYQIQENLWNRQTS